MDKTGRTDSIRKWIKKNGYPFEMQVAKHFRNSGFAISQSIMYRDSETNKYRETDIIAHRTKSFNGVWVNITFVIECKKSSDKPWILFVNKHLYSLQYSKYPVLASYNASRLIKRIETNNSFKSPLIFPTITNSGYNIVTAFSEKSDVAYAASQSVIKACEYLVDKSNASVKKFCNIYIPIIAIEGQLYEAFLNEADEIDLNQVYCSTVISTKSFEEHNSNLISIVSSDNLKKFTDNLCTQVDEFYRIYEDDINQIAQLHPTNVT